MLELYSSYGRNLSLEKRIKSRNKKILPVEKRDREDIGIAFNKILTRSNLSKEELTSRSQNREISKTRKMIIYELYLKGYKNVDIARIVSRSAKLISLIIALKISNK